MTTFRLILATLAVAGVGSAAAAEFNQFQAGKSSLTFVSKQMGVPIDGSFRKFAASLSFDPAKPAAATARLDLDLNSIDAGSRDANDEVVGKPGSMSRCFRPRHSFPQPFAHSAATSSNSSAS
ncbi:MAG: YceI family protein [Candidatus Accumulibacter propinquus]